jgi:uncharacterized membrane protein YphA (DoxX/SURF4 family)
MGGKRQAGAIACEDTSRQVKCEASALTVQHLKYERENNMNIVLWIVQILLALAFLLAGTGKVTLPLDWLAARMQWVNSIRPSQFVRVIGVLEVLGAIGLILPGVTGILPWLTPVAAIGLVLTMIGAMMLHIRRGEASLIAPNIFLLLLAAFVVIGRFVVMPL